MPPYGLISDYGPRQSHGAHVRVPPVHHSHAAGPSTVLQDLPKLPVCCQLRLNCQVQYVGKHIDPGRSHIHMASLISAELILFIVLHVNKIELQGTTKRLRLGLVNFVPAVASSIHETWPKLFRGALYIHSSNDYLHSHHV